jgi:hypothetical protein
MWHARVHLRSHALPLPIHAGPLWRSWARVTQEMPLAPEVHPVALTPPIARSLRRIGNTWWTTRLRMWPGLPLRSLRNPIRHGGIGYARPPQRRPSVPTVCSRHYGCAYDGPASVVAHSPYDANPAAQSARRSLLNGDDRCATDSPRLHISPVRPLDHGVSVRHPVQPVKRKSPIVRAARWARWRVAPGIDGQLARRGAGEETLASAIPREAGLEAA